MTRERRLRVSKRARHRDVVVGPNFKLDTVFYNETRVEIVT